MRKTFKKIAASVMAAATLAVGSVGMTASALTDSDGNSIFEWTRSGSGVSVKLTNSTGSRHYVQVSVYGYDDHGIYVKHIGNEGIVSGNSNISKSGNIYANSYVFRGIMYNSTVPKGTPISNWNK